MCTQTSKHLVVFLTLFQSKWISYSKKVCGDPLAPGAVQHVAEKVNHHMLCPVLGVFSVFLPHVAQHWVQEGHCTLFPVGNPLCVLMYSYFPRYVVVYTW